MRDFEETGAGHIHRFRLDDTMLAQPALLRMIKSLKLFASGLDSDLAMMVDINDRIVESSQIQLP